MDTRFPLLQLKHHCVKVTRERPREAKPITGVREGKMRCGNERGKEIPQVSGPKNNTKTQSEGLRA